MPMMPLVAVSSSSSVDEEAMSCACTPRKPSGSRSQRSVRSRQHALPGRTCATFPAGEERTSVSPSGPPAYWWVLNFRLISRSWDTPGAMCRALVPGGSRTVGWW
jgi:hypothetical protein